MRINYFQFSFVVASLLILHGCATYKPQQKSEEQLMPSLSKKVKHTFYLVGGYGNQQREDVSESLSELLSEELAKADKKSTLLFLGDNISEKEKEKKKDFALLDEQLAFAKGFKGEMIFTHGVNEWKDAKIDEMEEYEDYIEKNTAADAEFKEKNGCPLEHIVVNDQLDMIIVNSYWFITNWDRVEEINKKCSNINTRRRFAEELEGYINDAQDKNILIVMHHPIFSNGVNAGHETLGSHLLPVPVLGSVIDEVKDLSSLSKDQLDFPRYRYLRILVSSIAQKSDRVTVASGHEESLQYLSGGGIHQIISGSFGNASATYRTNGFIHAPGGTLKYNGKFTYGSKGFAKLEYYEDGSSSVSFITPNQKEEYNFDVLTPLKTYEDYNFDTSTYPAEKKAVIIEDDASLEKSGFYTFLWGERYRSYFNKEVTVPVALLDTLYGGLTVEKRGGGHQSNSLRLVDSQNREYAMRSLKKEALKFLTQKIQGISYDTQDYENTLTEDLVSDFFTTAHPFMQMVINDMADKLDINHSETNLFYVPKQNRLGVYNEGYGDELYYIERRPSEEQNKYEGYRRAIPDVDGKVSDFESTTDVLEKIKEDESYVVAQKAYIRARIFDMLIGDWDRHQDQWRWVEYDKDDKDEKLFIPVARDRDNTFSKYDGIAIPFIKTFSPPTRLWQSYGPKIKSVKWFNAEGHNLDQTFITKYGVDAWIEEAKFIQENLSEGSVDEAFKNLPVEIQDDVTNEIKNNLKQRLKDIDQYAKEYATYLNKTAVVSGTHKDDIFEITRMPEGKTRIVGKRNLKEKENKVFYDRVFDKNENKTILIYGLNDDDTFIVNGDGDSYSKIKIIGGYGTDVYKIENKRSIKVYDWEFEKSDFTKKKPAKQLTNLYETNTLHWRYFQEDYNIIMPTIGLRNDDGLFLGLRNTYTKFGIHGDGKDFKQQHTFGGNYFFTFQGFDLSYKGVFANIFPNWNFTLNGYYTSDGYANNFFGFGNETENLEDDFNQDFNRSQMEQIKVDASVSYRSLYFKALFESITVNDDPDRFVNQMNVNPLVFEAQSFAGVETGFSFDSQNAFDFPTKSLTFKLYGGYKKNLQNSENEFGYASFTLGGSHQLIPSGHLVLGTKAEIMANIGSDYFYYHAPSIGGDNGLRGFRNERFTGEQYFYQTTDLKLRIKRFVTSVFPVTFGTFGGFDYGRVWIDNQNSNQWHTSYGGGLWLSGADTFAFRLGMFGSEEGFQIQGGFGFEF
ncbi:metallophosphoesterase [Aquimarina addita]|uniref:Metallophosphoesterase n=1 Tax=Aquimarina addita TaxID=870485 RepID=A0ABP6UQ41_9FLAO